VQVRPVGQRGHRPGLVKPSQLSDVDCRSLGRGATAAHAVSTIGPRQTLTVIETSTLRRRQKNRRCAWCLKIEIIAAAGRDLPDVQWVQKHRTPEHERVQIAAAIRSFAIGTPAFERGEPRTRCAVPGEDKTTHT